MSTARRPPTLRERVGARLSRLWVRLLLVNVVVVLVPVVGLEFARVYQRQLLAALERDMNDQAALTRAVLEEALRAGVPLSDPRHQRALEDAARSTRTRVRVLGADGGLIVDSHAHGAPEGPEPLPSGIFRSSAGRHGAEATASRGPDFPALAERREVRSALAGTPAVQTRVARRPPAVYLFSAVPVMRPAGQEGPPVAGAVYVTRSTAPVLAELHRIRSGLVRVLAVALGLGAGVTLLLALSISRPLARLSRAARRIAAGERGVVVPVSGSGEIRELSTSFRTMTEELDARLAYISELSADVAHEFKSPLTSIRGAAELLAEGAHEDPSARERFLRNILLDAERLDRLVTRLLVLSRVEASREEPTLLDARSLVEGAIRRVAERSAVELSWQADRTWVRGRAADLDMALGNLLENAIRYSPPGEAVRVTATDSDGGIAIAVHDAGPGIPEARRDRVFERFYTTDADRGGTGLGLAIVSSVARAHGGAVTLEPAGARGSTFTLLLPGARQAPRG